MCDSFYDIYINIYINKGEGEITSLIDFTLRVLINCYVVASLGGRVY